MDIFSLSFRLTQVLIIKNTFLAHKKDWVYRFPFKVGWLQASDLEMNVS